MTFWESAVAAAVGTLIATVAATIVFSIAGWLRVHVFTRRPDFRLVDYPGTRWHLIRAKRAPALAGRVMVCEPDGTNRWPDYQEMAMGGDVGRGSGPCLGKLEEGCTVHFQWIDGRRRSGVFRVPAGDSKQHALYEDVAKKFWQFWK